MAQQSTIQRILDPFTKESVSQLREAVERIGGRYSRLPPHHPYGREMLVVEVNLMRLRASKKAKVPRRGISPASATPRAGRAGKLARSAAEGGWHEGLTAGQSLGIPDRGGPATPTGPRPS